VVVGGFAPRPTSEPVWKWRVAGPPELEPTGEWRPTWGRLAEDDGGNTGLELPGRMAGGLAGAGAGALLDMKEWRRRTRAGGPRSATGERGA
jgi:hypothetical protein